MFFLGDLFASPVRGILGSVGEELHEQFVDIG